MQRIILKKYITLSDGRKVLKLSEKMRINGAHDYLMGFDAQINNEIKDKKQTEQEIMFDMYKLVQNFREVISSNYSLTLFLDTIDKHDEEISEITKKFVKQKLFRDVDAAIKYFINFRKRINRANAI